MGWFREQYGHIRKQGTQEAKGEIQALFPGDVPFDTPKPERLLGQILEIATNLGDVVLDSFAGSGTTGAVAHKMKRKWVMVELASHCESLVAPRLRKVIDGSDRGGVSEANDWKNGGGFRFHRLVPSLLQKDKFDNWVISTEFNPEMLAEACYKVEECERYGKTRSLRSYPRDTRISSAKCREVGQYHAGRI